jgi:hypothetical protein
MTVFREETACYSETSLSITCARCRLIQDNMFNIPSYEKANLKYFSLLVSYLEHGKVSSIFTTDNEALFL